MKKIFAFLIVMTQFAMPRVSATGTKSEYGIYTRAEIAAAKTRMHMPGL